MVDGILAELSGRFEEMYPSVGRPSMPPEKPLRASLLQMLYSIRGERLLMEQLGCNLLFRWSVGRRTHHETCRLQGQPEVPQAGRGGLRMDEDRGRPAQDQIPGQRESRVGVHLRGGPLQPSQDTEYRGTSGTGVTLRPQSGKWANRRQ
jgi:hypothetical protein